MRRSVVSSLACLGALVVCGCSATKDTGGADPFTNAPDTGTGSTIDPPGDDTGSNDPGYDAPPLNTDGTMGGDDTATGGCLGTTPGDCDNDGYTDGKDDCNDHDGTINPEAYDFPDDKVDNDCDGTADNPVENCAVTTGSDPLQFGRAADLCAQHSTTKAGTIYDPLVKAEWYTSKSSGGGVFSLPTSTIQAGINGHTSALKILNSFGGNQPRMGTSFFMLSSGPQGAADPRGSDAMDGDGATVTDACNAIPLSNSNDCSSLTSGVSGSPLGGGVEVEDYSELRLYIHVPSNAQAVLFDFSFLSTEFNEYWHSDFNDAFFAIANTHAFTQNVAKDDTGKAITVNSGFFQLCPKAPGPSGVKQAAALANCVGVAGDTTKNIYGTLSGTNFDGAGAGANNDETSGKYIYGGGSGWLTTKFGVATGENIVVRFMIMDTSDGILDSAAVVDHITWEKSPPKTATGETDRPETGIR